MRHTEHYNFPLFDPSDRFRRDDFNQVNSALDGALHDVETQAATVLPAAQEAQAAAGAALEAAQGAVTTAEASAEAASLSAQQAVALLAAYPPNFTQATDPALVPANNVMAGSRWTNTAAGDGKWVTYLRNAANTGWEQALAEAALSTSTVTLTGSATAADAAATAATRLAVTGATSVAATVSPDAPATLDSVETVTIAVTGGGETRTSTITATLASINGQTATTDTLLGATKTSRTRTMTITGAEVGWTEALRTPGGSEAEPATSITFYWQIPSALNPVKNTDLVNCLSTHFKGRARSAFDSSLYEGICINSLGRLHVRILKSRLPSADLAGFLAWLADHHVTVLYATTAPTTETVSYTMPVFSAGANTVAISHTAVAATLALELDYTRVVVSSPLQRVADASLQTSAKTVPGAINELAAGKQPVTDAALSTVSKTVPGAINEVLGKLEGRYGVRWALDSTSATVERVFASVGKSAGVAVGTGASSSDFDGTYPWSEIRRVALTTQADGAVKILREGDAGFALDGSAGDVFVEIPKCYYERWQAGGYEYRTISATGRTPHPAFVENGRELDAIYVAAYEGAIDGAGKLRSMTGVRPAESLTAAQCLALARARGAAYTLLDWRTVDLIHNLMLVEHANRNSAALIGHGWADLAQPIASRRVSQLTEASTNRIVVEMTYMDSSYRERLFPGSNILIISPDQTVLYRRELVSLSLNTPLAGQCQIVFDGAPVAIDTTMSMGNGPQDTGGTDAMAWHTGRTDRAQAVAGSSNPRDQLNPNRYRWIENVTGNVWHFLPDVTFHDRVPYVCLNMADYQFHAHDGVKYRPVAATLPLQSDNNTEHPVTGLLLDRRYPFFAHPNAFTATTDLASHELRWGANYYLYDHTVSVSTDYTDVVIAHGGGFDHRERCNLMTHRAWLNAAKTWFLYGCRLLWKPV